jgi:nicotinamidase-related amidase
MKTYSHMKCFSLRIGCGSGIIAEHRQTGGLMASLNMRDQVKDRLITPKNSMLAIIDYQPIQVNSINSMDRSLLVKNVVVVAEAAKAYGLPVVLSTVNVASGRNKDTIPVLRDAIGNAKPYDRSSINAWEDGEFRDAVKATGRSKIIMCALWTEACLTFPALDAMAEGFDVYPVADAVGGTSIAAHEAALRRIEQAGAHPVSTAQLLCELQRDWNRKESLPDFLRLMFKGGMFLDLG